MSIIILSVLFLFFLYQVYAVHKDFKNNKTSLDWWRKKNEKIHSSLYNVLPEVIQLLEECDITYWATCGTLLGAIRHGGIIPWDDDIDLEIFKKDEYTFNQSIEKLEKISKKAGYELQSKLFGYKLLKNGIFIDLFVFNQDVASGKIIGTALTSKAWPNEWQYYHEVFPLKKISFGEIELNCPNLEIDLIKRYYGKDCLTKLIAHVPHYRYSDPIEHIVRFLERNNSIIIKSQ